MVACGASKSCLQPRLQGRMSGNMLPSAWRRMSGAVQDTAVAEENVIRFYMWTFLYESFLVCILLQD